MAEDTETLTLTPETLAELEAGWPLLRGCYLDQILGIEESDGEAPRAFVRLLRAFPALIAAAREREELDEKYHILTPEQLLDDMEEEARRFLGGYLDHETALLASTHILDEIGARKMAERLAKTEMRLAEVEAEREKLFTLIDRDQGDLFAQPRPPGSKARALWEQAIIDRRARKRAEAERDAALKRAEAEKQNAWLAGYATAVAEYLGTDDQPTTAAEVLSLAIQDLDVLESIGIDDCDRKRLLPLREMKPFRKPFRKPSRGAAS